MVRHRGWEIHKTEVAYINSPASNGWCYSVLDKGHPYLAFCGKTFEHVAAIKHIDASPKSPCGPACTQVFPCVHSVSVSAVWRLSKIHIASEMISQCI